jgi:Putative auto-transporter adhesin, head GIN domain
MRRFALPILILATAIVAAALAWLTLTRGSGGAEMTTEVRAVNPFHRLEISGRADVTLVEDASESVTVETAARGQSRVITHVENGMLMIEAADSRRRWWSALIGRRARATPQIVIAFKSLDAIGVSGTVKLTADRLSATDLRVVASGGTELRLDDINAQTLRIMGSGALKATLAGKVVEQKISISGAGEVRADQLVSQDAVVDVSGAGNIVINVAKSLVATISGAGSVEYYGDPEVRQSVSGVGRVKKRQSAAAQSAPTLAAIAAALPPKGA